VRGGVGNIEHRTPNAEHRKEGEKVKPRTTLKTRMGEWNRRKRGGTGEIENEDDDEGEHD
jgi:hypothetical protein